MAGKKTRINGILFDSQLEASHYVYFLKHPKIKIIKIQPEYLIQESFQYNDPFESKLGIKKLSKMIYTPDFLIQHEDYQYQIVIESKGFKKPDYMLRKKLFLNKYIKDKELYFIEIHSLKQLKQIFD